MFRLTAPFGEALLAIETTSANISAVGSSRVHPLLPKGMRVEDCWLQTLVLECHAKEVFTVTLRLDMQNGWFADYTSGQALDAFELRRNGTCVAAVGMRDPEWFCERVSIEVLEANSVDPGCNSLLTRYRTLKPTRIEIQAAVAWTNNPADDHEAISPWFAVDLAMNF